MAVSASGNVTNFALAVAPILNRASSVDEDHERSCEVRSHLNHELRKLSSATPAASNLLTKNLDADPDEANRTKTVKIHALRILVSLAIACGLLDAEQTRAASGSGRPAFVFGGVGYLHRWSMNHQHELRPKGQEELEKWSDMGTIDVEREARA